MLLRFAAYISNSIRVPRSRFLPAPKYLRPSPRAPVDDHTIANMQMKVQKGAPKLNAAKMRALLVQENEFITNLLAINDVPDSIHGKVKSRPAS